MLEPLACHDYRCADAPGSCLATIAISWSPTSNSSSVAATATARALSAWLRASCCRAKPGDCGGTNLDRHRHFLSAPRRYSSPSWRARSSVLPRAGMAAASPHPGPVGRIQEFHQRPVPGARQGSARCAGVLRPRHDHRHEKEEMRELILTGGPWSAERAAILDYCGAISSGWKVVAGDVAAHRSTASTVARPLHGRGCRDGVQRDPDGR